MAMRENPIEYSSDRDQGFQSSFYIACGSATISQAHASMVTQSCQVLHRASVHFLGFPLGDGLDLRSEQRIASSHHQSFEKSTWSWRREVLQWRIGR